MSAIGVPPDERSAGTGAVPRPELEPVLARLAAEPWSFHLYRAMRVLEAAYADRPRFGRARRLRDDPVRFHQEPTLAFAPSTLAAFRRDGTPALDQYVVGVFGPNGPLPLHLTEYARERERNHRDRTFRAFADLFHHRMIQLFYRSWAEAQPTVQADRPEDDRFALYVGALAGYGLESLRRRDAVPDRVRLHWAGLFAMPTRPAEGLRRLLAGFFEIPVRIEAFTPRWIPLPDPAERTLGDGACRLGTAATLGEQVWDCAGKFRIVLGPVGYAVFERFLPGRPGLARLTALVRSWTNDELAWDAQIVLNRDEVPGTRLDGRTAVGWNSWLLGGRADRHADDVVIEPTAA